MKSRNHIAEVNGVLYVTTSNGRVFTASACDRATVEAATWRVCGKIYEKSYAMTGAGWAGRGEVANKTRYFHREVLAPSPGQEVDHIDRNRLNNQRENLRLATPSQNRWNRTTYRTKRTNRGLPVGVFKSRSPTKRWFSQLVANRVTHYLGLFASVAEAEEAYRRAREKYHGEFRPVGSR